MKPTHRLIRTDSHAIYHLAAAITALLAGTSVQSATLYWDGNNSSWMVPSEWSEAAEASTPDPVSVPGSLDLVHFNVVGQNTAETVTLDVDQWAKGLVFDSSGTVTLASGEPGTNKLTLGSSGMLVSNGAGAASVSSPLGVYGADTPFNVAAGSTLTLGGPVTTSGGGETVLSKTGAGNFQVTGQLFSASDAPTKHRIIRVSDGRLNFSNSNVYATQITMSGPNTYATATQSNIVVDGTDDWGWLSIGNSYATASYAMHGGSLTIQNWGWLVFGYQAGGTSGILTLDNNAQMAIKSGSLCWLGDAGTNNGSATIVLRDGAVNIDANVEVKVGNQHGMGIINQLGGTFNSAANVILQFRMSRADCYGIYNLNGGTLTSAAIVSGDNTVNFSQNNTYFNFHGGTLSPTANSTNFIRSTLTGANSIHAPQLKVYAEGAVIDTAGKDITIKEPLTAPAGQGVSGGNVTIPVTDKGAGYRGTPVFYIDRAVSDTTGTGATAIANMRDDGSGNGTFMLDSITLTNPGINYTAAPTLRLSPSEPTTAATLPTLTIAPNVSGGLTKNGPGTLTLSGVNTYTADTTVTDGTLVLADNAGLKFVVTNDSNNRITGPGLVTLDGDFTIDTSAVTATTGTWTLVDVTTLAAGAGPTYGLTFTVAGEGWSETDNVWTKTGNGQTWIFTESTGVLELTSDLASSPYAIWASAKSLTGLDNDPSLDPDGDGSINLVEFAFNGDPLGAADHGHVYVLTADGNGDTTKELILTCAVRAGTPVFSADTSPTASKDGITYTIEGSTTLNGFPTKVNVLTTPVTTGLPSDVWPDYEYRSFSLEGSSGLQTKGFLRAKVSQP